MLLSFMIVIVNIIIIINFILISITLVIMIIIITNMSSGTFIVILNRDQYEYERLISPSSFFSMSMDFDSTERNLQESLLPTKVQQQGIMYMAYHCSLELHHLTYL